MRRRSSLTGTQSAGTAVRRDVNGWSVSGPTGSGSAVGARGRNRPAVGDDTHDRQFDHRSRRSSSRQCSDDPLLRLGLDLRCLLHPVRAGCSGVAPATSWPLVQLLVGPAHDVPDRPDATSMAWMPAADGLGRPTGGREEAATSADDLNPLASMRRRAPSQARPGSARKSIHGSAWLAPGGRLHPWPTRSEEGHGRMPRRSRTLTSPRGERATPTSSPNRYSSPTTSSSAVGRSGATGGSPPPDESP